MRRTVFLAGFLGWMVLLAGCAGGKLAMFSSPGTLQVTASSSTARAEDTLQVSATSDTSDAVAAVRWSVNGIPGGNTVVGTIADNGRYTAPASIPANNQVTIAAERGADRGSTVVTLWNPIPEITQVSSREVDDSLELTLSGNRFVAGASVNFGGTVYSGTATSATQLKTMIPAYAASAGGVELFVANPDPGAASSGSTYFSWARPNRPSRGNTSSAAARFLAQASFGATAAEIANINALRTSLGTTTLALNKYIDDQMNPVVVVPSAWPDWSSQVNPTVPTNGNGQPLCNNFMNCAQILWFQNALQGQDQLRQRAAFALSQIWVISGNTVQYSDGYLKYYETLNNRAFGNYFDIMKDVSLTSAMGYYLDMGNSAVAAPGSIANENYARELLQLFTIGLYMLNDDGTFQLDGNGERIPSYTEADVQEFARAFTGWTYQRNNGTVVFGQNFNSFSASTTATNRTMPMAPVELQHDKGQKVLLNYGGAVVLPANQQSQQDLDGALQNIFNHPNLPPFVCKQLIQHLVTSNPSPAYVQRVVDKFKNNGSGARGDLAAVIKAILMDDEARQSDVYPVQNANGHLREPVLYITGVLRGLGFSTAGAVPYTNSKGTTNNVGVALPRQGLFMGQNVLHSPSVFNYFTPDYSIQGGALLGPEFQLQTTANAPVRANFADAAARNQYTGSAIDVSASIVALTNMATNPAQLADQLDQQFMQGQMSAQMRQNIIDTVSAMPSATSNDRTFRARTALYLVISSSQYQVTR